MAGYSRLMERDEVGTLKALTAHREVMDRLITEHGGRIANTAGDSVLAEFPSAVDAVQCAMAVQEALVQANQGTPEERRLQFRIGVHVGDVMVRAGDLLGDGVNIAARLESLADPGGLCISEATYGYVRKTLPHAFEDLGPQTVKNIEEPVRAFVLKATAVIPAGQEQAKPLPLPDKPSIAVLPLRNMSGGPEQDYLADGLTEEIVAALSRFRSLFVIAYSSTATYKGKAVDVRQVSRELGVRYVLEGSVRRVANRLRIIAQLIDATTGSHIWTDRYDGDVTDLFDLQDRVTEAIVGALEPTITLSEIEWAKRKRPDSLDAYGCVMRALPAVWSQDPHKKAEGLRLAEQAMDLDPTYALSKALAAWCYAQRVMSMTTSDPSTTRTRALQLAREAASLDSNDPLVLTVLSAAYNLIGQVALGLAAVEKALTLDPNSAWAWLRSGWSNTYMRRYDTAIEHFQRAMRLSPLDPMRFSALIGIGAAYLAKDQWDEAARWIEKGLCEKPDAAWGYRLLIAAYAAADRLEEAKQAAARFLEAYPDMTVSKAIEVTPPSSPLRGRIAAGLRKAGLPE
ncbi:adenylate/guanylate cyclase domain-containing protein [Microvirga sp. HBU67558]